MDDVELDFGEDEFDNEVMHARTSSNNAAGTVADDDGEDAISFGRASPSPAPEDVQVQQSARIDPPPARKEVSRSALDNGALVAPSQTEPLTQADHQQGPNDERRHGASSQTSSARATAASQPAAPAVIKSRPSHDETLDREGKKLPPGWISRISRRSTDPDNNMYFRHVATGRASWDRPLTSDPPPPIDATPAAPAAAPLAGPAITELATQSRVEAKVESQSQPMVEQPKSSLAFVHPDRLRLAGAAIVNNDNKGELHVYDHRRQCSSYRRYESNRLCAESIACVRAFVFAHSAWSLAGVSQNWLA